MTSRFRPLLSRLADGATLSETDAEVFFTACLKGEATPAQVAAAVTAMRLRGETVGEVAACARAMRRFTTPFAHDFDVIDTCGTGGDGSGALNISTAAALVAAGGGAKVAKHGNRALSSRSGSSDVLAALGVNLQPSAEAARRCLDEAGVCFLYAPAHNGAMRHVTPIRAELGFRTVFNLLGPLSNPAGARRQVLGVYDVRLVEPLARVLGALGSRRAWVAHGSGLDELTTTGVTEIAEWRVDAAHEGDGGVRLFRITPEAVGLPRASLQDIQGGEPEENARALSRLLDGETGAYRDIVLLNAAAAFLVADLEETLEGGIARAAAALDDGSARRALDRLVALSHGREP